MKLLFLVILPCYLFASIVPADYVVKESKVDQVIVYSDRALVTRTIKSINSPWLKLEALPNNIDKDSIKVKAIGANGKAIKQIIVGDSFYKNTLPVDVDEKIAKLESLYLDKLTYEQEIYLLSLENNFLRGITYSSPYNSASQKFLIFEANTKTLEQSLSEVANNELKNHLEIQGLNKKITDLNNEIRVLKSELSKQDSRRSQKWLTDVFINVDNKQFKKSSALEVSYYITNSHWIPQYDVRCNLNPKKGIANINLVSFGQIKNETGENWKDVKITLSSIDPTPLYLPKLNRWLFSEKREEVPQEKGSPGMFGNFAEVAMDAVAPQASRSAKVMKKKHARRAQKVALAKESEALSDMVAGRGGAPSPMREGKFARDMEPQDDMALAPSYKGSQSNNNVFTTRRLTSIYNDLLNKINVVKQNRQIESQFRPYFANNSHITPKKRYLNGKLPAMQANGRKLEFESPFLFSLNTHEEPIRIPTTTTQLNGKLKYLIIPKKDPKAYIRTEVANRSGKPILGGQANIYLNGDLTSKTQINTTNENSTMLFDLGIDELVEAKRVVKKKSEKDGMIFKKHQVVLTIEIEVVNNHNFPIELELKDNYPKTPNEEIEVKLLDITPKPVQKKYGIIEWNKRIAALSKEKFTFKYRVTHPENFIIGDYDL